MPVEKLYLKPDVLVEPLINQWYAWSCLVPPHTAAMYIANSHLKIMQSFVATPQAHVAALKNPAMAGGPFINHDVSKVGEIKALMDRTKKEQSSMLQLADAIKSLDDILLGEASGYSFEPIYQKVPDALKGFIELVYDLNNHPSVRFIEALLYNSPHYDLSSQSIALSLINRDYRPFVFSTPRLEGELSLHITLPFESDALDKLFKMRRVPQPFGYIKDVMRVEGKDDLLFSSFFTNKPSPSGSRYTGRDVRIRYFGHATILIESADVSILTDPVISYTYPSEIDRYTYDDLPEQIDYVLITHNHQDHCLLESLLQLRHRIKNLIVPRNGGGSLSDPSLKLALRQIGFGNVMEIDEMESIEVEGGSITGLPFLGEHADLNIRTKTAYLMTLKGRSAICAADSNNIEPKLYENVHQMTGDVDVIFLGMECVGGPLSWIYGPLLTRPLSRKMDQSRRFDGSNSERALGIIDLLKPKHVYVYAMGQEPWLTFLTSLQYTDESLQIIESNKLIDECRRRGMIAERLFCQKEIILEAH